MARKAIIIGQIEDSDGFPWDVREVRQTSHGFDLFFGWPVIAGDAQRGKGCGGPRLIPTKALYAYWEKNKFARDGSIYNLPASRSCLKRVRAALGCNLYLANEQWWIDRLTDLCALSGAAFSRRHSVAQSDVSIAHTAFFGPRQRPNGWYSEPAIKALLMSDLPHGWVAQKFGISIGASQRLRSLLKRGTL
jgi:hypothetical protein